ncbi:metallophosphoesterase family protein [Pseudofrankia sp. DC12]|uniref:metallophosphoesterase family protein n=1 Tax=Pseudofrankia sp. DC12 TaxID=683315 RepID=UPI0005F84FE1|nr:metallophosphoesterase family protein [Pseudofrankia sp. DC12]
MTRLAVLSDIHGNTRALETVLAQVTDVDAVLNLGDILSGAVDPRGTLDLLAARPDILTIRGNHERQILTFPRERMGASDRHAADLLTDGDRAWLANLPETLEPAPGMLAFHASPADDLRYLNETVTPDGLRPATKAEIMDRLGDAYGAFRLFLCGHSHLPRVVELPDGSLVVNPGSVGWPAYDDDEPLPHIVETGSPHARYAVLDDSDGTWHVDLRTTTYDAEWAARLAEAHGRSDIAHQLRTGRVTPV